MKTNSSSWQYQATVIKVKDGDTIEVDINLCTLNQLKYLTNSDEQIDLGFSTFVSSKCLELFESSGGIWLRNESIRFYGLNAPEKYTQQGKDVSKYVAGLLPIGSQITLETLRVKNYTKQEKYGRYLGRIILPDEQCLNDMLLMQKLAVPMMF